MVRIRSLADARAHLAASGVITLVRSKEKSDAPTAPALVDAIAGERVSGSWWSHPAGKLIFRIASDLDDAPEVLSTKLGGRVAFVHQRLWPSLLRVVTAPELVARRREKLSPAARALLEKVESEGRVYAPSGKTKTELEASALVRSFQEHTDAGKHVTVLESWRVWAAAHGLHEESLIDEREALENLWRAGIDP